MSDLRLEALAAKHILAALRATDESLDEDDALCAVSSETSLPEAVEATLAAIAMDEAHVEAIKDLVRRLKDRAQRKADRAKRRRFMILAALELAGLPRIECAGATVSVGKGQSRVIVTDEAAIPPEYVRETVEKVPDLKAIAEAIKAGVDVPGAELSNAIPTLIVRTA